MIWLAYYYATLLLGAAFVVAVFIVVKLKSDVRLWRDYNDDLRGLWHYERDLRLRLQETLQEERKQRRDGVYR